MFAVGFIFTIVGMASVTLPFFNCNGSAVVEDGKLVIILTMVTFDNWLDFWGSLVAGIIFTVCGLVLFFTGGLITAVATIFIACPDGFLPPMPLELPALEDIVIILQRPVGVFKEKIDRLFFQLRVQNSETKHSIQMK